MLIREKLVRAELAAAEAGIHEVGGNNHGPQVRRFLHEVGLPEGYAWCDAFQSYEEHAAAGRRLPIESASVAQTKAEAEKLGWIVRGWPARGDLVLYDFDGDGQTDDHIGLVYKRGKIEKGDTTWHLFTIEGNTSSGEAGSQGDGDGVFLRERRVERRSVCFVRIPGNVPAKHAAHHLTRAQKQHLHALRKWIEGRRAEGWSWERVKATGNWREYVKLGGK